MRIRLIIGRSKCKDCKTKLSKSGLHFCKIPQIVDYTISMKPVDPDRVRINGTVYVKESKEG